MSSSGLTIATHRRFADELRRELDAAHRLVTFGDEDDAGMARLVEMRFFGGMTALEIADALGISERTVQREWQKARALLLTMIQD